MLDPFVHHQLPDKDDDVVFTYVTTGSGDKFGVGSEIAKPTMSSFLFYKWIPDEDIRGGSSHKSELEIWDAKAVAAQCAPQFDPAALRLPHKRYVPSQE